jgi:hypothetical protein
MKTILMHVSDEFYAALHEVADGVTQVDGMGFVIDGVREEPMFSEAEGEDIAVMVCNLACAKWAFVTQGTDAHRTIRACDQATSSRFKGGAPNSCPKCHEELCTWIARCPACGGEVGQVAATSYYEHLESVIADLKVRLDLEERERK